MYYYAHANWTNLDMSGEESAAGADSDTESSGESSSESYSESYSESVPPRQVDVAGARGACARA